MSKKVIQKTGPKISTTILKIHSQNDPEKYSKTDTFGQNFNTPACFVFSTSFSEPSGGTPEDEFGRQNVAKSFLLF